MCVCVCVCVCARARACVRVCVDTHIHVRTPKSPDEQTNKTQNTKYTKPRRAGDHEQTKTDKDRQRHTKTHKDTRQHCHNQFGFFLLFDQFGFFSFILRKNPKLHRHTPALPQSYTYTHIHIQIHIQIYTLYTTVTTLSVYVQRHTPALPQSKKRKNPN